jgi:hypothetical protein
MWLGWLGNKECVQNFVRECLLKRLHRNHKGDDLQKQIAIGGESNMLGSCQRTSIDISGVETSGSAIILLAISCVLQRNVLIVHSTTLSVFRSYRARWYTGIVGSNPTLGLEVCDSSVCVVLCR